MSQLHFTMEEYYHILRADFCSFVEATYEIISPQDKLLMHQHIELMCAKLQDCAEGKIKRLIINIPPRHLKSICASVALPAFILGHNPAANIICASYGQDLADKLARDTRSVMTSPFYKHTFRTRISSEKNSVNEFVTTQKGGRVATSVGGVLTGRGADFIIIDDALKPEDALSETRRNSVNEWFDNTLLSRLNSKLNGCIIIIMQRLHMNDLVGHVIEKEKWEVLTFPAIAEEEEYQEFYNGFGLRYYWRKPGVALHPEREPLDIIHKIRDNMGEYNFVSQYQQNPQPKGGNIIKSDWLKYYVEGEQPSEFERIIQSWDTANKTGETNDYSACTTWGIKDNRAYLLHVFRRKLEYPALKRTIVEHSKHHNAKVILIEDKASGTQLIQDLKADQLYGLKGIQRPAGCDKAMRLEAASLPFENGAVFLPNEAPWLKDYVAELTGYPGTKHDDQVDSTSQFIEWFKEHGREPGIITFYRERYEDLVRRGMV